MRQIQAWCFTHHQHLLGLIVIEVRAAIGIVFSIFLHELGHLVASWFTSVPASGFSMGVLSLGYGYYWPGDRRRGFFYGRLIRRQNFWWLPHVYSFPIPSTGWERILKAAGGPIGSLLSAVGGFAYLYSQYRYPNGWQTNMVLADLVENAGWLGFMMMGVLGFVQNSVPLRWQMKVARRLYRISSFRSARLERWLYSRKRERLISDGDRIGSGIVRAKRGRKWNGAARTAGSYYSVGGAVSENVQKMIQALRNAIGSKP